MGKQKGGNFKRKKYQRSKQDGGFLGAIPMFLGNMFKPPQKRRRAPTRQRQYPPRQYYPPPQYYTHPPITRTRIRKKIQGGTQRGGIVKGEWGPHNLGGPVQITPRMIQRRQKSGFLTDAINTGVLDHYGEHDTTRKTLGLKKTTPKGGGFHKTRN
ncbi:Hypothetical predicted protein [Paramuricea clavata]|uniref:Uncharacterized protein n=1 Tax=Paramuricea clavata TaxID=317549 RepID=A0A6S7JCV2_PARCT|nr:Hypothetical predicted protein [Paramuricea clavata]